VPPCPPQIPYGLTHKTRVVNIYYLNPETFVETYFIKQRNEIMYKPQILYSSSNEIRILKGFRIQK
jgi:hypothetical protein